MPIAKTLSKLSTATDDAAHTRVTHEPAATPGGREAAARHLPAPVEFEALDAADEDPYFNVACTD